MPKLFSSDEIIKVLRRQGFIFVSQKGSHIKFRKHANPTLTVIVPAKRKQMPVGTFNSILRQANLAKNDFDSAL